jgi:hypothetical protein
MLTPMADKPKSPKKKPGPDPETLVITEDPEDALRRLFKRRPPAPADEGCGEPEPGSSD